MKVLLFGTGFYYERFRHHFQNEEIVALLDNDKSKIGTLKDGIVILSPDEGIKKDFDVVFIMSSNFHGMMRQLMNMGVPKKRILTAYHIGLMYTRGGACVS